MSGLALALREFGSISLAAALAPAIRLAERGVPTTWTSTLRISAKLPAMLQFPETLAVFAPRGRPLNPAGAYSRGDTLVQKDLARTLRTIATAGASAFYDGELARAIDDGMRRSGGLITAADLASYEPIVHDDGREVGLRRVGGLRCPGADGLLHCAGVPEHPRPGTRASGFGRASWSGCT